MLKQATMQRIKTPSCSKVQVTQKSKSFYGDLQFNTKTTENTRVLICVTGYCCKLLVRKNRCDQFKQDSVANIIGSFNFLIPKHLSKFFNAINHGGLWKPIGLAQMVGAFTQHGP